MPLLINIRHLDQENLALKGQLPASELDLADVDELIKVEKPLKYQLEAQKLDNGILVQGNLEITLDCECARCLKQFMQAVKLENWTAHLPLEGPEKVAIQGDFVDLTPQIREDILLEFPQHPLCGADCQGLPNRSKEKKSSGGQTNGSSAWSELNKLKF